MAQRSIFTNASQAPQIFRLSQNFRTAFAAFTLQLRLRHEAAALLPRPRGRRTWLSSCKSTISIGTHGIEAYRAGMGQHPDTWTAEGVKGKRGRGSGPPLEL